MSGIYRYVTRSMPKAQALFASLTDAGHATQLTNLICPTHGAEGYVIDTRASEAEFKALRAAMAEMFPSTNPSLAEMPSEINIPDHLPTDFS